MRMIKTATAVALAIGALTLSEAAYADCVVPRAPNAPAARGDRLDRMTSDRVQFTGGCIDGIPIGQNTPAAGNFSSLSVNGIAVGSGGLESDPVVGAVTGIPKADGAGNISAAVAGTDYAIITGTTCTGTDKVSAINPTTGAVTCTADTGGGAGGEPAGSTNDIQTNAGGGSFGAITPGTGVATFLATPSSANLRAALTDEVGTGAFYTVGGALGTPASATLTNATGLPPGGITAQAANTLIGNPTGSSAAPTAITLGANLSFSGGALVASGLDLSGVTDGSIIYDDSGTPNEVTLGSGLAMSSGTLSLSEVANEETTTARTIGTGDANETVFFTNVGASTANLTAVATLGAGFGVYIDCQTAAGCTIDPAGAETINGAATLTLKQYQKSWVKTYNGTSWTANVEASIDPSNASNMSSGTLAEARGGTGITALGTGVATFLGTPTSANAAAMVTNETGSGALVFATSPTLVTPVLGTPTSGDATNLTNVVSMAPIGWVAGTVPGTMTVFTATQATTVVGITGTVETAVGGTATVAFYKTASGTACASGTNQISAAATFNANGTANTNQTLTLAGGAANILASGDRICAVAAGAGWTSSHTGSGGITVKVRI